MSYKREEDQKKLPWIQEDDIICFAIKDLPKNTLKMFLFYKVFRSGQIYTFDKKIRHVGQN